MHALVALVTMLSLVLYLYMSLAVGFARGKFKVEAPTMAGHPDFERYVRVQANTLEWLVIFLPSLWICAVFFRDDVAAGLGGLWIVGRFLYMLGYWREPKARSIGFLIQGLTTLALMLLSLGAVIWSLVPGH